MLHELYDKWQMVNIHMKVMTYIFLFSDLRPVRTWASSLELSHKVSSAFIAMPCCSFCQRGSSIPISINMTKHTIPITIMHKNRYHTFSFYKSFLFPRSHQPHNVCWLTGFSPVYLLIKAWSFNIDDFLYFFYSFGSFPIGKFTKQYGQRSIGIPLTKMSISL